MEELINSILNVIQDWAPVIYAAATVGIGMFFKFRDIAIKKKKEIDAQNEAKNKENYLTWKHEESSRVITKIKDLCNFFKDRGKMDSVSYIQLENGTVAASKLCNMFVTCLAEDDRFSTLPKYMDKFQRIPYSKVSYWADMVATMRNSTKTNVIMTPNSDALEQNASIRNIANTNDIKSSIIAPVYDPNGILIGAGLFLYGEKDFNGMSPEEQKILMTQFKTALETVFLEFYLDRIDKMKEFNITGGDF